MIDPNKYFLPTISMATHRSLIALISFMCFGCLAASPTDMGSSPKGQLAPLQKAAYIPDIKRSTAAQLARKVRGINTRVAPDRRVQNLSQRILDDLIAHSPRTAPNTEESIQSENREFYDFLNDLLEQDAGQTCQPRLYEILTEGMSATNFYKQRYYGPRILSSSLLLEALEQRDFLLSKPAPKESDLQRAQDLEALLQVIGFGFVPHTPPQQTLAQQFVLKQSGEVNLGETLAQARPIGPLLYEIRPVYPTSAEDLKRVLTKDDINLIDYMAKGHHYLVTGRYSHLSESPSLPMVCIATVCKAWADFRQDLKRFDSILKKPNIPRAPGDVYRGIGNFPKDKLEHWLSAALRGEPLYLGVNNQPEVMFASRSYDVARNYRDSVLPKADQFQVILIISQKNGTSVESVISSKAPKIVLINSSQKFKMVEIFKDKTSSTSVHIKLEEI